MENDDRHTIHRARALAAELKHTINEDRYALSPRIRTLRGILDKLEWRDRLVCSRCGGREVDMVVTRERR